MRVLYFSNMIVTPGGGGGNTVFNLLEPSPDGCKVFYATPNKYQSYHYPFPEISSRIYWYPCRRLINIRGGSKVKMINRINDLFAPLNDRELRDRIGNKIIQYIKQLGIDVLLVCPQLGMLDVMLYLMEKSHIPTVAWFMDNYYTDASSISYIRRIWEKARQRLVVSEAMQRYFSEFYGGDCEVLNNSVLFSEHYPEPSPSVENRLRVIYTGSINPYYLDCVSLVLKELDGLDDQLILDFYSPEPVPSNIQPKDNRFWRRFSPIPPKELGDHLQKYDILLLISSFKPEHQVIAETSLASKVADYMAAGRCILTYGPEYSENVRYMKRYGLSEVVTSKDSGCLRKAILSLANKVEYRQELGKRAYYFGREHHNKSINSAKLWQILSRSLDP